MVIIFLPAGFCCSLQASSEPVDKQFSPSTSNEVRGRFVLQTDKPLKIEVLRDDYQFSIRPGYSVDRLPDFDFAYVQDGDFLVPVKRGSIPAAHPQWEYILEPGSIRQDEKDHTVRRVSLPFTLQERNANCMHNGVLSFSLLENNLATTAGVNIASETCLYFKFNLSGSLPARYQPGEVPGAKQVIAAFRQQRAARLPLQPIDALAIVHPAVDLVAFAGAGKLAAEDNSVYGFVIDDVHYRSACATRNGVYPFCEVLNLPSYSIAKTLIAGLAAMRLEKLYPGTKDTIIADYVPQCRGSGNWDDVSFTQALNMLTGNFGSASGRDDEAAGRNDDEFFLKSEHGDKILFSCNAWPRKSEPGSRWVYHTSDTYVVGTAMNAFLREKRNASADIYQDLVLPLWRDMTLSPALGVVRRSYDHHAQPLTALA